MADIENIIFSLLQRIQADLTEVKREVIELKTLVHEMSDRLDKVESYITYSLGMISQQKADLDRQGRALLALRGRVDALETPI